ncbi:prepilin peptidase [Dyella sp. C11]|uniref:A24 family peptidase n=1 Tax=Dyella sp. C11 TaxID=2126991 RepID=UPI000D64C7F8|nr:prepilin peptidase [Dyella sp. C11]
MGALLPMLATVLGALVVPSDLYARRVPNAWLIAALGIASVAAAAQFLAGVTHPVWPSIPGLLTGLASMLPFYALRWMGAGDVKLFATLGFLLGVRALLPIWIIGCLLTGVHAVAVLLLRRPRFAYGPTVSLIRQHMYASSLWQRSMLARQGRVGLPHAAYLGIGTLVVVMHPELMAWRTP